MLFLNKKPSLLELQKLVKNLEHSSGLKGQNTLHKCLTIGESLGELFKAIRVSNQHYEPENEIISEEILNMIFSLCSIANKMDINLDEALQTRNEIIKLTKEVN